LWAHFEDVKDEISLHFFTTRDEFTYLVQQEFDGKLNFATYTWLSQNHKAYIMFTVYLENHGKPMSMLLNIGKVTQLHTV